MKGSSNPHNLVKATILALSEMRDARMVAQNRGVSMEKVSVIKSKVMVTRYQER